MIRQAVILSFVLAALLWAGPSPAQVQDPLLYGRLFPLDEAFTADFRVYAAPEGEVFFTIERQAAKNRTGPLRPGDLFNPRRLEFGIDGQFNHLAELLEKGVLWWKVSREQKIETAKEIGFMGDRELVLVFVSEKKGALAWIDLDIPYFRREGYPRLRLSPEDAARFAAALRRAPDVIRRLRNAGELTR